MSDWQERLRKKIQLNAPDGTEFNAFWAGDERSKEKKLGVFDYPDTNGSGVQDLGINSSKYNIPFFFEGFDHDLRAEKFFNACDQSGIWQIIHPTKGFLYLNLVSVTEKIQPITKGNITEFETQWIQPIPDDIRLSSKQISSQIEEEIRKANEIVSEQYAANLKLNTATEVIANKKTILDQIKDAEKQFNRTIQKVKDVYNEYDQTIRSVQEGIDDVLTQAETISDQIQKIPRYISQIPEKIIEKVQSVSDFIDDSITRVNNIFGIKTEDKNTVNVCELNISAGIQAVAEIIITEEIETRNDAIQLIEMYSTMWENSVSALDIVQDNFSSNNIENKYFSNSLSFNSLSYLISLVFRYLIESSVSIL